MSEEPTQKPSLPEKFTETTDGTYDVPHVLVSSDGQHVTIREGSFTQVKFKSETWYSEDKLDEPFLKMSAKNSLNFGGHQLMVLNDDGTFNGKKLAPSNPTATEYLSHVGQETVINFLSQPIVNSQLNKTLDRPVFYRNTRVSVVIP